MLIKGKNFCFGGISRLNVSNGDTVESCNLTQLNPNTAICAGYSGLTFIRCNLLNCVVPSGSIVEDCLTIQKSFCSHLGPDMVDFAGLSGCADDCSHVVDSDEIWIDGVLAEKIYHYEDTII